MWEVLFDDECWAWFLALEDGLRDEISAALIRLRQHGPHLGRPLVDTLKGSNFKNLKELRVEYQRQPWRILFAFDPERRAVMLVGGNKATDKRWYQRAIALAEKRYRGFLEG